MKPNLNRRLDALRGRLEHLGASSFLVTDPLNVFYVTGFQSSNAAVLVAPEDARLFTDGRYVEAARAVADVDVEQCERDVASYLGKHLEGLAPAPVAVEADHLTVAAFEAISESGVQLVSTKRVIRSLRAVKDEDELDAVRGAARVVNRAFELLAHEPIVGRSESEVAWWIERTIRESDGAALAFDVIVAAGPNAALPHHHSGERPIGGGETVVVDAGARVGGYCSDCTRTFATRGLDADLARAYDVCLKAQLESLRAVRAGTATSDVDAVARGEIEASGIAEVLHGLGHGVGLEVHELPVLNKISDDVLAAGNVVTIEPGVYLAGQGGVRIEDELIVHDDGVEVLTPVTKEIVVLE